MPVRHAPPTLDAPAEHGRDIHLMRYETVRVADLPASVTVSLTTSVLPFAFFGTAIASCAVPLVNAIVRGIDFPATVVDATADPPESGAPVSARVTGKLSESSVPARGAAGAESGFPIDGTTAGCATARW